MVSVGDAQGGSVVQRPRQLTAAFHTAWQHEARADAVALADEREQITYSQLFERVGRMAGALRAAGVREGDRIALDIDRSVSLAIAILATMAAGACPCPLEPDLDAEETRRRFALARIGWLLADAAHRESPAAAALPAARHLALEAIAAGRLAPYWALDLREDAPGFLLFTSGSSGRPKGVLQSHRGLLANALGVIAHTGLAASDRLLHVMPLHHTNGVNNQILAPLLAGCSVFIAPRFRAEAMPGWMRLVRPTILTGVPTIYSRMLAFDFAPQSLAALRMLRCGSAPITEELHRRIEAKFERPLVVSYGLSEATCTSTMNPPDRRRIGAVGTVLQGQDVFLQDADGRRIGHGSGAGEICIAGSTLMLGYLTESSLGEPEPPGEAIRTGDLGRFDDDGFLHVTGRIKDVIIRGGENLSPQLIESVICELPGVAACCVVGGPHADLGETPVAFVVQSASAGKIAPESLQTAVSARLGRSHRPSQVVFVDVLPENSVGKVDRKVLAARLRGASAPFA